MTPSCRGPIIRLNSPKHGQGGIPYNGQLASGAFQRVNNVPDDYSVLSLSWRLLGDKGSHARSQALKLEGAFLERHSSLTSPYMNVPCSLV
jgi:hypothetical protein